MMGLGFAAYTPAITFQISNVGIVAIGNLVRKANWEVGELLVSLISGKVTSLNFDQAQQILEVLQLCVNGEIELDEGDLKLVQERIPELIDLLQFVVDNEAQLQLY